MRRKKIRHLLLELVRRMYYQQHGTLKGFGKVARFYDGTWAVNFNSFPTCNSYKDIWNSPEIALLRKSVNM